MFVKFTEGAKQVWLDTTQVVSLTQDHSSSAHTNVPLATGAVQRVDGAAESIAGILNGGASKP